LEDLDSDVARRYREINELQLMNELNRMSEKITESDELSQEEKIQRLKEVMEKIQSMESEKREEERRRRFADIETANVARRLIEEINKSEKMSREEKIAEIQELLDRSRTMDREREKRRSRSLVEFQAAESIRKMLQEIAENKNMSEKEKAEEFQRTLEEAQKLKLESTRHMIGVEKFKFELHQLLKKEGLLPEGKAKFILRSKECLIDGKKLPDDMHKKILALCEESLGKSFDRNTKIVLQLNEDS
jgi:hypothetical protein